MVHVIFLQAEDGIRDLVRSRGLGDVYKRQLSYTARVHAENLVRRCDPVILEASLRQLIERKRDCLLYTSDAADERSSVDLGGRRIIKKKIIRTFGPHELLSRYTTMLHAYISSYHRVHDQHPVLHT